MSHGFVNVCLTIEQKHEIYKSSNYALNNSKFLLIKEKFSLLKPIKIIYKYKTFRPVTFDTCGVPI